MLHRLKPNLYINSIYHLDFKKLCKRGIKGIIVDLDNTITEWNNPDISDKAVDWFKSMIENNLKACIVSNNNENRVVRIANLLGIPYIAKANKPRTGAFKRAMTAMGTVPQETAVVGDQIFTDILGGNRLNLYTILVVPLNDKEFIGTRVVRVIERKVLSILMLDKIE
ncbi:MAG: YqeG family HAD IIIA-type phosphatase [Bacillota bacterium]